MTNICAKHVVSAKRYLVHLFAVKVCVNDSKECINITIAMHREVNKIKHVKAVL